MTALVATFGNPQLGVTFAGASMGISTGKPIVRELVERTAYTGPTQITPSADEQTLETKNLRMTDDIVINPIPSNYGLITWDGSTITVS